MRKALGPTWRYEDVPPYSLVPILLAMNRQIYAEELRIFYGSNTFHLPISNIANRKVHPIPFPPDYPVSSMRHVSIQLIKQHEDRGRSSFDQISGGTNRPQPCK